MKQLLLAAVIGIISATTADAQNYRNSRYYNPSTDRLDYSQGRHDNYHRGHGYDYSNFKRTYFGFRIGPAFTTVSSDDARLDGGSMKTGLNVGFAAGAAVSNQIPLFIESGLYYIEKGGKGDGGNLGGKFTYNLDYLEVPLVFKYSHPLTEHARIEPYVGGYFAVGIGGKIKNYGEREAYSSFSSNEYDDGSFKRFDAGLKMGVGLSYDMFYMDVAYDLGLRNICHDTFDDSKNGALLLNFGLNF